MRRWMRINRLRRHIERSLGWKRMHWWNPLDWRFYLRWSDV